MEVIFFVLQRFVMYYWSIACLFMFYHKWSVLFLDEIEMRHHDTTFIHWTDLLCSQERCSWKESPGSSTLWGLEEISCMRGCWLVPRVFVGRKEFLLHFSDRSKPWEVTGRPSGPKPMAGRWGWKKPRVESLRWEEVMGLALVLKRVSFCRIESKHLLWWCFNTVDFHLPGWVAPDWRAIFFGCQLKEPFEQTSLAFFWFRLQPKRSQSLRIETSGAVWIPLSLSQLRTLRL